MSWAESMLEVLRSPVSSLANVLAMIGALVVAYYFVRVTLSVWNNFRVFVVARCCRRLCGGLDIAKLGSWAVVTGATDGIGKEYAIQLARNHRLNIVLISRSIDKLNNVAREIASSSGVQTKCISVDFSARDLDIYDKVAAELHGLDIAVLVNNVGMVTPYPDLFANDFTNEDIHAVIRVNINSVTFMTRIVLPGMVSKRKGLIINLSSQVGTYVTPLFQVYSATKAYVDFFSRAIGAEYRSKGITVQTVVPGFVATPLSRLKPSWYFPDAASFVSAALPTVGIVTRTAGCWLHNVIWTVTMWTQPECLRTAVVRMIMLRLQKHLLATEPAQRKAA